MSDLYNVRLTPFFALKKIFRLDVFRPFLFALIFFSGAALKIREMLRLKAPGLNRN